MRTLDTSCDGDDKSKQVASIIEFMIPEPQVYSIETRLIEELIYNNVQNEVCLYKKNKATQAPIPGIVITIQKELIFGLGHGLHPPTQPKCWTIGLYP